MALKLLLDQGIPVDSAPLFRGLGYECWHVSELGMQRADDEDILALAIERGAILITLDSDFHALVAIRAMTAPSVIRLRREGCRAEAVVGVLREVLARYHSQIAEGCLISVTKHRSAVHRLPVEREE